MRRAQAENKQKLSGTFQEIDFAPIQGYSAMNEEDRKSTPFELDMFLSIEFDEEDKLSNKENPFRNNSKASLKKENQKGSTLYNSKNSEEKNTKPLKESNSKSKDNTLMITSPKGQKIIEDSNKNDEMKQTPMTNFEFEGISDSNLNN